MQDLDVDKPEHYDETTANTVNRTIWRLHQSKMFFSIVQALYNGNSCGPPGGRMGSAANRHRPYNTHLLPHYNKKACHINVLTNFNGFWTGSGEKNSGAADDRQPRYRAFNGQGR